MKVPIQVRNLAYDGIPNIDHDYVYSFIVHMHSIAKYINYNTIPTLMLRFSELKTYSTIALNIRNGSEYLRRFCLLKIIT